MSAPVVRRAPAFLPLLVALVAVIVCAGSLANGFALDDQWIIVQNDAVHGLDRLASVLTAPYWPESTARLGLYRPLTTASFALDWALWDGEPLGFHAVNVVLHGAVSAAVLLFLLELGVPVLAAVTGALLFAVHPVHVEAVANVVGRAELLAAFFFLIACVVHLRRNLPPRWRAPVIPAAYLLALGAKEIAVTLPAVLLLLDAWRDRSHLAQRLRRDAAIYLGLAAAAILYGALRTAALGFGVGTDVAPSVVALTMSERLANAAGIWPEYFRLLFFPRDLVADYSPGVIPVVNGWEPRVLLGLALGGATLLLAVLAWRRDRLLSLAILWFAITILPVSNLLFPVGVLLAERTLYLPSVAVAVCGAWLAARAYEAGATQRRIAAVAAVAVLLAGAAWTWHRTPVWRSTETALHDLALRHPESYRVRWLRGADLLRRGSIEAGLAEYRAAVDLAPGHYALLVDYGLALINTGGSARAVPVLERAIELVPEHEQTYVLLSQSFLNERRYADARDLSSAALHRLGPRSALYHQLAQSESALGNWSAALMARRMSIRLAGTRADWRQWLHLAGIHSRLEQEEPALRALERARLLAPPAARVHLDSVRLDSGSLAAVP